MNRRGEGAEGYYTPSNSPEISPAPLVEGGYELQLPLPLDQERIKEMADTLDFTSGESAYVSLMELVQSGSIHQTPEGDIVAGFKVNAPEDYHHTAGTVFRTILPQDGEQFDPVIVVNELALRHYSVSSSGEVSCADFSSPTTFDGEYALERLKRGHALRALHHEEAEISSLSGSIR